MSKQGLILFSACLLAWSCLAQTGEIFVTTLNCHAFFGGGVTTRQFGQPETAPEFWTKARNLAAMWPSNAPLVLALQEIGGEREANFLAQLATKRYGQSFEAVTVETKDTYTQQAVGALVNLGQGWKIAGTPARAPELDKDLSKHLALRLTNQSGALEICVVHLKRSLGKYGRLEQQDQNRALKNWAAARLEKDSRANLIVLGDFNETREPGDADAGLAPLAQPAGPLRDVFVLAGGKFRTHAGGKAYDRVLISAALAEGTAGWKFQRVFVQSHSHGKGAEKKIYSDHFPVTSVFGPAKKKISHERI